MAVDLSAMRNLFEGGALKAAIVAPAPMQTDGWVFMVELANGKQETMTVARSTRQKIYKSFEAVRADAERIGFRDLRVQLAQ